MSIKGWFSILVYFLVGCGSLALVGIGVSKILNIGTSSAHAQTKPVAKPAAPVAPPPLTAQAPQPTAVQTPPSTNNLPGPEDVDVDAPADTPPAPEEMSGAEAPPAAKRNLGILEGIIEEYDYRGQDKRDPFAPFIMPQVQSLGAPVGPVTELERYDLEQLRLVGIIWGVPKPKALFLDPNQKTYVVFNKTRIGRNSGYVAEIREGEVVIIEAFNNDGRFSYQPRIIKLQRE